MSPLRRYLDMLRGWVWLLLLGALLAGGVSYLISRSSPRIYSASAKLLVTQGGAPLSSGDINVLIGSERLARTYADLITTRPILERTGQALGLSLGPDELRELISVRLIRETQLLEVSAEHADPQVARDLANGIAATFIQQNETSQQARFQASRDSLRAQVDQLAAELERSTRALNALETQPAPPGEAASVRQSEILGLTQQVSETQRTYANVLRTYEEVRIAEARSLNSVTVVEPAALPTFPVKPRVLLNTLVAGGFGGLLALGLVFFRQYVDDSLPSPQRLGQQTGLSTLAVVGELPPDTLFPDLAAAPGMGTPNGSAPNGSAITSGTAAIAGTAGSNGVRGAVPAEAYHVLRTNLQFSGLGRRPKTVLVTSAEAGEGKTTTATNLAAALALAGFRTLLVDADLRHPSLHRLFKLDTGWGLTPLLRQGGSAREYVQETPLNSLRVLAAGPAETNPSELLGSRAMSSCLKELARMADYVVLDSQPVLAGADALALASQVDGVLLVVDARRARSAVVLRAQEALHSVHAKVLGAVLNRAQPGSTRSSFRDSSDAQATTGPIAQDASETAAASGTRS